MPSRRSFSTALATALACAVLLPLLGHRALAMWDEGIYAEVSREMLRGSWLVPRWNGQVWFEKPPLEMWLTALTFKVFGLGEWQARIVSALSGIAIVALLHAWLTRQHGNLAAWFSTIILLSSFGFQHAARAGETDTLLSLSCLVALLGLCTVLEAKPLGWIAFWLGFAFALMTKGAASFTLLIALLIVALVEGRRLFRFAPSFYTGLLSFLAITLPWHLFMLHRYGSAFVSEALGFHVIGRATSAIEGHHTHWWFYLSVLVVSAAPWALLYPAALVQVLRNNSLLRPLAIFALVEIIFFSIARTRLPHYIAPAYAPVSAITGVWFAVSCEAIGLRNRSRLFQISTVLAVIAVFGIATALTASPRKQLHSSRRADGVVTPDNRETAALLHSVFAHPSPVVAATSGPLLLWTENPIAEITTAAFYSRRPVVEVQLNPPPPGTPFFESPFDKYTYAPLQLGSEVNTLPRLVLLDLPLAARLPAGACFKPLQSSPNLALGLISRCSAAITAKQVDPAPALR